MAVPWPQGGTGKATLETWSRSGGLRRAALLIAAAAAAAAAGWLDGAWIAAGVALGLASAGTRPAPGEASLSDTQRHLEVCRRRAERAAVVVVQGRDQALPARALLETLRITDSAAVSPGRGAPEVHAVLDEASLDRPAFERRLEEALGARLTFGWAAFPDDGLTLEALVEQARISQPHATASQTATPNAAARASGLLQGAIE